VSHDLTVERVFDAAPEVVFDAFTDSDAQRELYADAPDWIVRAECDLRVGGRWSIAFGPPGSEPARETNLFQVVDRPRRLVFTSTMTMPDGSSVDTSVQVSFQEENGGTRMTILQRGFPTAGLRDDFAGGWPSILDGLGRVVSARVAADPGATMALPQGDLGLLRSEVAKRLLTSTVPARFAYIALDGTPRVVPTWFHWTGDELIMPTFLSAPHVRHAAARLPALRANPDVAVTIDTEGFPPTVLSVRGRASVTEVDGVVPEYALAARRYMGEEAAGSYLAHIDQPVTRMARVAVRPTWVGVIDFQTRLPSGLGGVMG
jgi:uncharacterized protein YndB with AHSA1/START domain